MLLVSIFVPYWRMKLVAPQYPQGLQAVVYLDHLEGDIQEIDELNHYLGMPSLNEGGRMERSISLLAVVTMSMLLAAALFIHNRWAALAALPALGFPLTFLADMQYILHKYGHSIDPQSALGGAIKPFTPTLWGQGVVGQFSTESELGPGLWLALGAGLVVLISLWLHRRIWKTVLEATIAARSLQHGLIAVALALLTVGARPAEAHVLTVGPNQPYARIGDAVVAAGAGDIVRVMPGTYRELVIVRKPIVLEGIHRPIIDGGGRDTVVTLAAPRIVFRGFNVRGSGNEPDQDHSGIRVAGNNITLEDNRLDDVLFGILAQRAAHLVARGNDISGKAKYDYARKGDGIRLWECRNAVLENNRVHGVRDCVAWYSRDIRIIGNTFEHNRYGIHFMYADGAHVVHNRLLHNSVGIYTMYTRNILIENNDITRSRGPSGYALGFKDVENVSVLENQLSDNRVGMFVDGASQAMDTYFRAKGNCLSYNDVGVCLLPSVQRARFSNNNFLENDEQVSVLGGGAATANEWRSNRWSDYAGYDADGDGVGDTPYRSEQFFENLSDRFPNLQFFHHSLAQLAVDTAARLFPIVAPQPKLEDPTPLVAPRLASLPPASWGAGGTLLALMFGTLVKLRSRSHGARVACPAGLQAVGKPTRDTIVEVDNLFKSFGHVVAAHDISLRIAPGEAVALWGSNGAGKTTVIRCLLGLLSCEGRLRVGEWDVRRHGTRARKMMGYVPQELRFHDDLTVNETLQFYASLRDIGTSVARNGLARVGIESHAAKRVGELSGGLKQRLALAIALLADPPVLLLDEPGSNLDLRSRRELLDLLGDLKLQGKTLLFSAHHLDEVAPIADRVLLLEDGRVRCDCSPQELRRLLAAESVGGTEVQAR